MRVKERTDYGDRLFKARRHAALTQAELAKRTGMSQSNLAELETTGQGSAKTPQLATATGVRVQWLAEGVGTMLEKPGLPADASRIAAEEVAPYLINQQPSGADYRTIAVALAEALEASGTAVSLQQFVQLVDATFKKLSKP